MFSFLTSRTSKTVPPNNIPQQSRNINSLKFDQSLNSNLESGYDDVSLESGEGINSIHHPNTTNYNNNSSRPDFSRQLSSTDSFVGGGGGAHSSSTSSASTQYPPLPITSRPSPTSGYPSLRSTFIRLETHLANSAPSLLDTLSPPLQPNSPALTSLINAIAPYKLPNCVIEAYSLHDGQDPFASTSVGLIWGLWWMPLDLVEIEWKFWRKFEQAGGSGGMNDAFSASTEGKSSKHSRQVGLTYSENIGGEPSTSTTSGNRRNQEEEIEDGESGGGTGMNGMSSFPKGWIRRKYSHPGWLPLLTDRAGNYVGIDLDPPPLPSSSSTNASSSKSTSTSEEEGFGQPGQVIAFGREIDEKVVLFPGDSAGGWGRFLAGFTDDVIRGEFARLGEVKRGKRKNWSEGNTNENLSNRDREGKRGSGSDDEWNEGDGIGESSYLDGDRYGDEGEESGGSEENIWTLRTQYRRWLSEVGEGGIVGALAERSRRKWRSVGVGLPIKPSDDSETTPNPSRNGLSVFVPNLEDIEPGPESGATERPRSPNLLSGNRETLNESNNKKGKQPEVVEVRLSPPSPPKKFSHQQQSNSISSSTTSNSTASRDYLHDGRSDRRPNSNKPRRRAPPPAPMPLDLPTMFDISYTSSTSPSPSPNYQSNLPSSDQPYDLSPRISSTSSSVTNSPSSTKKDFNIDTINSTSSTDIASPRMGRISPKPKLLANGASDSTVMLVQGDEGDSLTLTGLGLSNPSANKSTDLMEIIVS